MNIVYIPTKEIGKYSGYGIREMKMILKINGGNYRIICHSFDSQVFVDKFKKELSGKIPREKELQREIPEWIKNKENFSPFNRLRYNRFKKELGLSKKCNIIS